MTTGLVYDEAFLLHRAPYEHPEHPGRLSAIWQRLIEDGLAARCRRVAAREATRAEVLAVHTPDHVQSVEATARSEFAELDPDTFTSRDSAEAARLAAGALVDLVGEVLSGSLANGFALLRPPGHHAEAGRAMGFCLFNNVAVAAQAARRPAHRDRRLGPAPRQRHPALLRRGSGDPVLLDASISVLSRHRRDRRGRPRSRTRPHGQRRLAVGDGRRRVPRRVRSRAASDRQRLRPRARAGVLRIRRGGRRPARGDAALGRRFAAMTQRVCSLARGRAVLALEGGYNLEAISAAAPACTGVLLGDPLAPLDPGPPNTAAERVLRQVIEVQRPFWPAL